MSAEEAVLAVLRGNPKTSRLADADFGATLAGCGDEASTAGMLAMLLDVPADAPSIAAAICAAVADPENSLMLEAARASVALQSNAVGADLIDGEAAATAAAAELASRQTKVIPSSALSPSRDGDEDAATVLAEIAATPTSIRRPTRWKRAAPGDLLAFSSPSSSPLAAATTSAAVCRHFLAPGGCLRTDCPYSHDTATTLCLFFATSEGCSRGDTCAFLHTDADVAASAAESDAADSAAEVTGGREDERAEASAQSPVRFPVIGGMPPTAAALSVVPRAGAWSARSSSALSMPQRLQLLELQRKFPSVSPAHAAVAWERAGGSSEGASMLLASHADFGALELAAARVWAPVAAAPATVLGLPSKLGTARRLDYASGAAAAKARLIGSALAWAETGGAVATLYAAARREAEALAKARNLAYERATSAFKSGDGASASRFAAQGRTLDADMRRAHAAAAARIFAARNESHTGAGANGAVAAAKASAEVWSGSGSCVSLLPPPLSLTFPAGRATVFAFDLHGLHPREAADIALSALDEAASGGVCSEADDSRWCAFIVGTRHHSRKFGRGGGSLVAELHTALDEAEAEYYDVGELGGVTVVRV